MPTTYNYNNLQNDSTYYGTASNYGNYQFVSLADIIDNFMAAWCGEGAHFTGTNRGDVNFHAHRALQELSFDTFKSVKDLEVEIPPSLIWPLPKDYINYVKIVVVDANGIENILYPTRHTSNPFAATQNAAGTMTFNANALIEQDTATESQIVTKKSDTWTKFEATGSNEATTDLNLDNEGARFGINPAHAQNNGSFFINDKKGVIHFTSNISGKTIIIKYISDGLGTSDELQVHKLAEEAMYQSIAYALACTKTANQGVVGMFKQSRFAEVRKAKIRLSNIKIEEITQMFRGIAQIIKH